MKKYVLAMVMAVAVILPAAPAHAATMTIEDPNTDAQVRNAPPARAKSTAEIKKMTVWKSNGMAYFRFHQAELKWRSTDRAYFTLRTGSGWWRYSPQLGMVYASSCIVAVSGRYDLTTDTVTISVPTSCFLRGRNTVKGDTEFKLPSGAKAFDGTRIGEYTFR
ncbi:hypothetical protein CFH99_05765 [Nocardioides aromaticivorans]|uniref:Uncharacterized protein n=1 Tax=Nocardioides aromaticivorans TaxID=200618 RepID=A0ABX7PH45_9ACTN|nr:hypothetical protein [Nocardioides aromaticivorans]QSR25126.1 hypothetical protein CFH99_05765 [Nocardioides aromaticivorans]